MVVYVDNAQIPYGRMKMCHMVADTPDELHAMADRIGVKRKWYQWPTSAPHYDICLEKRKLAVENGAREVGRHELSKFLKWLRPHDLVEGLRLAIEANEKPL